MIALVEWPLIIPIRFKRATSLVLVLTCIIAMSCTQNYAADIQSKVSLADSLMRADKGTELHIFNVYGMGN